MLVPAFVKWHQAPPRGVAEPDDGDDQAIVGRISQACADELSTTQALCLGPNMVLTLELSIAFVTCAAGCVGCSLGYASGVYTVPSYPVTPSHGSDTQSPNATSMR